MAFSFDSFRNLFSDQKPEQVKPSFTPASGNEVEPSATQAAGQDTLSASLDTADQLRIEQADFYRDLSLLSAKDFIDNPNLAIELSKREEAWTNSRVEAIDRSTGDAHLWFPKPIPDAEIEQLIDERRHALETATRSPSYDEEQAREEEMEAREELLHYLEEQNAPEEYQEDGLTDNEIEVRDRIYDMDWKGAQRVAEEELRQLEQDNPTLSSVELLAKYEAAMHQQAASAAGPDPLTELLHTQEENIRREWQHDLESGRQNQHDLETYFAGKIDQHNTLIELAVQADPKLQETLPPQIDYEQLRSELQQQLQQQPQPPAQAMEMAI